MDIATLIIKPRRIESFIVNFVYDVHYEVCYNTPPKIVDAIIQASDFGLLHSELTLSLCSQSDTFCSNHSLFSTPSLPPYY
jgi:hypothetical protein